MRIVSGTLKSRMIEAPYGLNTRPTSDKTREAIFNILQCYLKDAIVLDLFAGSGALGIEAISRGAQLVTFIDKDYRAIQCIKKNCKNLAIEKKVRIFKEDYKHLDRLSLPTFDIILLDPPYQMNVFDEILTLINQNHLLSDTGIIVYESNRENQLTQEFEGFEKKQYRYGIAHVNVLKRK